MTTAWAIVTGQKTPPNDLIGDVVAWTGSDRRRPRSSTWIIYPAMTSAISHRRAPVLSQSMATAMAIAIIGERHLGQGKPAAEITVPDLSMKDIRMEVRAQVIDRLLPRAVLEAMTAFGLGAANAFPPGITSSTLSVMERDIASATLRAGAIATREERLARDRADAIAFLRENAGDWIADSL